MKSCIFFLSLIFMYSSALYADSITTYDSASPSDNDNIYRPGQVISVNLSTTNSYNFGTFEAHDTLYINFTGDTTMTRIAGTLFRANWNTAGWPQGSNYEIKAWANTVNQDTTAVTTLSGIILDATAPTVTNVNATGSVHASPTWGSETVTFVLTFSDTGGAGMDTSVAPTVSFGGTNVAATTGWSGNTWTGSCSTAGLNGNVTLTISGAKDRAGNTMNADSSRTYAVDTDPPGVSGVTTSPAQPTTFYGGQNITFTITFDEVMNQSVQPTVSYCGQGITGSWQSSTQWAGSMAVPTGYTGAQALNISGAQDAIGNTMVNDTSRTFNVDSVKPTIQTVVTTPVAPAGTISTNPFPQGYVTFEITFSETMNNAVTPTVTLGGNTVNQLSYSGATWTGRVQITAAWGALARRALAISGAKDANGNTMDAVSDFNGSYYWVDGTVGDATLVSTDTWNAADLTDNDEIYDRSMTVVLYLHTQNDTSGAAQVEVKRTGGSTYTPVTRTNMTATGPYGNTEYDYSHNWTVQTDAYNGQYQVYFYYGNGKQTTMYLYIDSNDPTCTVSLLDSSGGSAPFSAETLILSLTFSDPAKDGYFSGMDTTEAVTASLSGIGNFTGGWKSATLWTGEITLTKDQFNGTSTLSLTNAVDKAKNACAVTNTYSIDTSNPSVTSITPNPAAPFPATSVTFTIVFNDGNGTKMNMTHAPTVKLLHAGSSEVIISPSPGWSDNLTWAGSATVPGGWTGTCAVQITDARDLVGYTCEATQSFNVDTINPYVVTVTPADNSILALGTATFELTFNETMDVNIAPTVTLDLKNVTGSWQAGNTKWKGTITIDSSFTDGTKELSVTAAKDPAGNTMTPFTAHYWVDATAPTIETVVATPPAPFMLNDKETFEITFNENMKTSEVLTVKFDGKTVTGSWTGNKTWAGTITIDSSFTDGTKELSISGAKDSAGGKINPDPNTSFKFAVDVTVPKVSSVNPASPDWFRSAETVTFGITFSEAMTAEATLQPSVHLVLSSSPSTSQEITFTSWSVDYLTWTGSVTISSSVFSHNSKLSLEVKLGHDIAGNTMETWLGNWYFPDYLSPTLEVGTTDEDKIYKNGDLVQLWTSSEISLRTVEVDAVKLDSTQTSKIKLTEASGIYTANFNISTSNTIGDGTRELTFYGYDTAENSTVKTSEVFLDNTKPYVWLENGDPLTFSPSVDDRYLSRETCVVTVYFYDSSEVSGYGMDLNTYPDVKINTTSVTRKYYSAEVVGGKTYAKFTGEIAIDTYLEGIQTVQISGAKDKAGNTMTLNDSNTVEIVTDPPSVTIFKMYHNGRLLNNSGDYVGIGNISCEVTFSDKLDTRFTPEIRLSDAKSIISFSTSEGTFVTVTQTLDTYRSGTLEIKEKPGCTLEAGLITAEISNAHNLSGNILLPATYKNYMLDTIRPTLEAVAYQSASSSLIMSFSENIRGKTASTVNPDLYLYDSSMTNLFPAKFSSYSISGKLLTVVLSSALSNGTFEVRIGTAETTCIADMAYNSVNTTVETHFRKTVDFSAPTVSGLTVKDYENSVWHTLDSQSYFLKYHPNLVQYSNADSVEISFNIHEPEGMNTASVRLYWQDTIGESGSTAALSFSGNSGTIEVKATGVNLTTGCPRIGLPGFVKFWVVGYDLNNNGIINGNSSSSPAGTVEVRNMQPVASLKAEVNPRLVYPGRQTVMKVSMNPSFEHYDSGIERIKILNLPSTPSNISMRYLDASDVWHDISAAPTITSTDVTLAFAGTPLHYSSLAKTIEVSFTVTAKASADPPAGVTFEVKAANTTTQSYLGVNNTSMEISAFSGECDGKDNTASPSFIRSLLNVQTRKPATSAIAEITPYLAWPSRNSVEITYSIYPSIDSATDATVNRAVIFLDGLYVTSVKSLKVGGSTWSGAFTTFEVNSPAYKSTLEVRFSDSSPLNLSRTIEVTFYAATGPENLSGRVQQSYVDYVYPGMTYPVINLASTAGNADGNSRNGNTMTLYVMESSGGGVLSLSPQFCTPDPARVNQPSFTAVISPLIPAGSPGIDFFRLHFFSPSFPDTFEIFSLTSVKVSGQNVSFSYNSSQIPGSKTLEVTLSNPVTANLQPVEIAFKTRSTRSEATGEVVCAIANTQNGEMVPVDTVEIKSGYPVSSTGGTTLEVLLDGFPTGKQNVPTSSTVSLRYTATAEIDSLNLGVDKLMVTLPLTGFALTGVSSVKVDNTTVEIKSTVQNGVTLEILLKSLYSSEISTVKSFSAVFTGMTSSSAGEVLSYNLWLDNSTASYPTICNYQGIPMQQQLITRRVVTSVSMGVSPNLVSPLDAVSYHSYQTAIAAVITSGTDSGINRFRLSLPDHFNTTIEAVYVNGMIDSTALINSVEATLSSEIKASTNFSLRFKAQPPRSAGNSVLDYPAGKNLSVWVDNTSVTAPKLISDITSGMSANIAVAGVISGGTLEVNNPNSTNNAVITVASQEIVLLTFKPVIPSTHAGVKKFTVISTSGASFSATGASVIINSTPLTVITSGTPQAGQALVVSGAQTLEITLGSSYGSSYSEKPFQVYFPFTASSQGFYDFSISAANPSVSGSSAVSITAGGDVESSYTNNTYRLEARKSLLKSGTLKAFISPSNVLTGQEKQFTYYIRFDASPSTSYTGIDSLEILIPSAFTWKSAGSVSVYANNALNLSYTGTPTYSSGRLHIAFSQHLTNATFEIRTTFTLTSPQSKSTALDFLSSVSTTSDGTNMQTTAFDYNGDGQTDRAVRVSANFSGAVAEISPSTVYISTEVTYNLAIAATIASEDNGINQITVKRPDTHSFRTDGNIVSSVSRDGNDYAQVSSPGLLSAGKFYVSYISGSQTFDILLGTTVEASSVLRVIFSMKSPGTIDAPAGKTVEVKMDNFNNTSPMTVSEGDAVSYIAGNSLRIISNVTQIESVSTMVQPSYNKKWKIMFTIRFTSPMDVTQVPEVLFASTALSGTRYPLNMVSYLGDTYVGWGEISYSDTSFGGSVEIYASNCIDIYGNFVTLNYTTNLRPGFALGYFFTPLTDNQLQIVCRPSETLLGSAVPSVSVTQNNRTPVNVSMSTLYSNYYKGVIKLSTESYYLGNGTITGTGTDIHGLSGTSEVSFTMTVAGSGASSLTAPDRSVSLSYSENTFKENTPLYLLPADSFSMNGEESLKAPETSDPELVSLSPLYMISKGVTPLKPVHFSMNVTRSPNAGIFYLSEDGKYTYVAGSNTGEVSAELPYLSQAGYFADVKSPSLSCLNQMEKFTVGESVLRFKLADNGSGISPESVSLTADGKSLSPKYVPAENLLVLDSDGMNLSSGEYQLSLSATDRLGNKTTIKVPMRVVSAFTMTRPYAVPNPASNSTLIHYTLGTPADKVTIKIYDSAGKRVRQLTGDTFAGDNFMEWDLRSSKGKKVSNGVYLIRIEAELSGQKLTETVKLAVLQ